MAYKVIEITIQVKKLLIKLQHVCNELKDKNEIAIIEKYGYIARCYTAGLIGRIIFLYFYMQLYSLL